jgi:hypothetical protein
LTDGGEITVGYRKLNTEKLRNLYSSPNIIRTIKSRRIIWTGHAACIGVKGNTYRIFCGKARRKETSRKT